MVGQVIEDLGGGQTPVAQGKAEAHSVILSLGEEWVVMPFREMLQELLCPLCLQNDDKIIAIAQQNYGVISGH
ncbi:hypothetical protein Acid7E03_24390 [Acidisoma sp. 7E03]